MVQWRKHGQGSWSIDKGARCEYERESLEQEAKVGRSTNKIF
jgi:hypothetical protein